MAGETKWTPGPWDVMRGASLQHVGQETEVEWFVMRRSEDVAICADVMDPRTEKPSEANARLIAAAPDLYEALSLLVAGTYNHLARELYENARAALAKARGES